jgi:hypothetical protein
MIKLRDVYTDTGPRVGEDDEEDMPSGDGWDINEVCLHLLLESMLCLGL